MTNNKNILTIEIDADKFFYTSMKEQLLFKGIKDTLDTSYFLNKLQDRLIQKILEDKIAEDIKKSFLEKFTKWTTAEVEKAVNGCNYEINKVVEQVIKDNEDIIKKPVLEFLITNKFSEKIGKLVEEGIKEKIISKLNFEAFCKDCDEEDCDEHEEFD
jgi:hypothetical protein